MLYLKSFTLPNERQEDGFLLSMTEPRIQMRCYSRTSSYPFKIFPQKALSRITFEPLTVFYGTNGSGKSTLLNIIAEKLRLIRAAPFNNTPFFEDYLRMCSADANPPRDAKIITSDAVFDFMLDMRAINDGVDRKREALFEEYDRNHDPNVHMQLQSLAQYEEFKQFRDAKKSTKSDYTYRRLPENIQNKSNGESAYAYFTEQITQDTLYLLDEPENSLSAAMQRALAQFLVESVRFYNCQLVISTHSPFLLAMKGAKIYNLDAYPAEVCRWTELEAVRTYYDFFREHDREFK
ncbi:MAG: ATP-binding cassette domain-containing protein [Ruminococcaceae bacterium]|nr:ATP-binding cassette domain-containing protein [Oscillospiraceae bacterium]